MSKPAKHFYEFGDFRLDATEQLLRRGNEVVPLTQRAFDLLVALLERPGEVVSKEELMQRVWAGSFVEEGNLTQNIYTLRRALGKASDGDEYIRTVPRRGYRFAVNVSKLQGDSGTQFENSSDHSIKDDHALVEPSETDNSGIVQPDIAISAGDDSNVASHNGLAAVSVVSDEPPALKLANHPPTVFPNHKPLFAMLAITLIAGLVASGIWLYKAVQKSDSETGGGQMTVTSLTTTGNLQCAAISPDGKYVAYAVADRQQGQSLWLMQLSTLSARQIIEPAEVRYFSVTFSPGGDYVYYVKSVKSDTGRHLYRVQFPFGGAERRLVDHVGTAVAFSPNGRQMAFRRALNDRREAILMLADADGGNERELARVPYPETFQDPAWSPDGKWIACATGRSDGGLNMQVVAVSVTDGSRRRISEKRWRWVGQMACLREGDGLMMVASDAPAAPYQVWRLDYASGDARQVTNDANYYNRLSLAADGQAMVVTSRKQITNLWLLPRDDPRNARQLTYGAGGVRGGVSWTPDGKIVFDSQLGAAATISLMNADGGDLRQLTSDTTGQAITVNATASPDGRYIVYSSDIAGKRHIWRKDTDGSNPVQLTSGDGEDHPACTPDGRFVIYTRTGADRPSLWRVPIDGGESRQLTDALTSNPVVSPDGKQIACLYAESPADTWWRIALFSIDGGQPLKVLPNRIEGASQVQWLPDGKAVSYVENLTGVSKIWIQPVTGGAAQEFVEFDSDRIFGFAWSPDGKHLACVRGFWSTDAVLVKDFR